MFLSYLPDEMIDDFERMLRLGAEWGLRHVEVRLVDGVNVLDLSDQQIERAKALIERHGMRVSAVATPFFKCPLPGRQPPADAPLHGAQQRTYHDHLELLPRGVEIARAFGAPVMRIFSFWYDPDAVGAFWRVFPEAVDAALAATAGSGVIPALENEGACFIQTSADLVETMRRLPEAELSFIWDPGNATWQGMPPRAEDVEAFFDRIALVHLKDRRNDAATGRSDAALIGEGDTDYRTELQRLHALGYRGTLTLEPHYCPQDDCVEGMRRSLQAVRSLARDLDIPLA